MFVFRGSLFVAVALLALSAIAEAIRDCQPYRTGITKSPAFAVPVNDTPLPPGIPKFTYSISPGGCPPGTGHVGTELKGCDEEVAPVIKFYGLNYALITRPNPVAYGVVHGKIYCQPGAVSSAAKPTPFAGLGASDLPHLEASVQ